MIRLSISGFERYMTSVDFFGNGSILSAVLLTHIHIKRYILLRVQKKSTNIFFSDIKIPLSTKVDSAEAECYLGTE